MDMISTMDSGAIRFRLDEITGLESAHAARDLDAELAAALRAGGDVDALENAQLDAERTARRLRVERQALEAELPESLKREGADEIEDLQRQHGALVEAAPEKIDAIASAWSDLKAAIGAWGEHQKAAETIASQIGNIAHANGLNAPKDIGYLVSRKVIGVRDDWHAKGQEMLVTMTFSERSVITPAGARNHRVD